MIGLAIAALLLTQGEAPQKQVSLWVARDLAPAQKIQIQLQSVNVRAVHLEARKLTMQQWVAHEFHETKPIGGALVKAWDTNIATQGSHPPTQGGNAYYSRQVNLPAMPAGLYVITAAGGGASAYAVVNVTHLSIVSKQGHNGLLVWVTDVKTGTAIKGAAVSVWRKPATETAGAKTDGQGIARFDPGATDGLVAVRYGGDLALQQSQFESSDGRLKVHVQTDRPIYRPGQTVHYKAILRAFKGAGYENLAGRVCQVEVVDPFGDPAEVHTLKTNSVGTLEGSYSIPRAGALGTYGFQVHLGDETGDGTFTVQEYRKPEFKVAVQAKKRRYLAGETVEFDLAAQYYFGVPVQQAEVSYTVRSTETGDSDFTQQLFFGGDGNLYPSDRYGSSPVVANDVAHTDAEGKATISVPSKLGQPDILYQIECTVQDVSRRIVETSSSVPVFAAQRRIQLASSLSMAPVGSLFPLELKLRDLDGHPQPGTVKLTVTRPTWNDKTGKYEKKILTKTQVRVPAKGAATVNLPAAAEGTLYVLAEADDGSGRTARATFSIYVAGFKAKPERIDEPPFVTVKLDKRTYTPGDTLNAFIETNVAKRPILVTLEGTRLFWHTILPPGRGRFVKIPLGAEHTPNAYLVASVWADGDLEQEAALVPVPDVAHRLDVSVTPDKQSYRPGDSARYTVQTRDSKGRPVSAEVGVGVVDEAIYALMADNTSDPYAFYWGRRANGVATSYTAPEEMSGGAYQRANSAVPLRQRFEDTAFWNARVTTGADGLGTVSLEMPGNLTTWRATARAIDAETRGGSAISKVISNRPVMLRLATPRHWVAGDLFRLIGTVNNRTDKEREFTVHLEADRVGFADGTDRTITVPANSQTAVSWQLGFGGGAGEGRTVLTASIAPRGFADPTGEYSDRLRVTVPIVPRGYAKTVLAGGVFESSLETSLALPAARLRGAGELQIEVFAGLGAVEAAAAQRVFDADVFMPSTAAASLHLAALRGLPPSGDTVRESLAFLSRTLSGQGWGWLEGAPMHPRITAAVLQDLLAAKKLLPSDRLVKIATLGSAEAYRTASLWEDRAILASAVAEADPRAGAPMVDEVLKRGIELSPYARLRLAAALVRLGRRSEGIALAQGVLADAKLGPSESFVPSGFGIGWTASDVETTAEALQTLGLLGFEPDVQRQLARWVARARERWLPHDEEAAIAVALHSYLQAHPEPKALGDISIVVDGEDVPVKRSTVAPLASALAELPTAGDPKIVVRGSLPGELFYTLRARVYLPPDGDHQNGALAIRRFEVRAPSGLWQEVARPIRPGEPVRCTVVVWGDDVDDLLQIVEPMPAGFEHVESDPMGWSREEVRDGAVIHYVPNSGTPQVFRYYLRSESEGSLTALPVTVESVRRPDHGGRSDAMQLKVVSGGR